MSEPTLTVGTRVRHVDADLTGRIAREMGTDYVKVNWDHLALCGRVIVNPTAAKNALVVKVLAPDTETGRE